MNTEAVLLDTSFLIRLLNEQDNLHVNALNYFRYFLENGITCKISTIAVAEYCVKGSYEHLPLDNLQIIPFNIHHAIEAGRLCNEAFRRKGKINAEIRPRCVIPNDVNMFAQAHYESEIHYFATSDTSAKKVYSLLEETRPNFKFIDINTPYNDCFGILI